MAFLESLLRTAVSFIATNARVYIRNKLTGSKDFTFFGSNGSEHDNDEVSFLYAKRNGKSSMYECEQELENMREDYRAMGYKEDEIEEIIADYVRYC